MEEVCSVKALIHISDASLGLGFELTNILSIATSPVRDFTSVLQCWCGPSVNELFLESVPATVEETPPLQYQWCRVVLPD